MWALHRGRPPSGGAWVQPQIRHSAVGGQAGCGPGSREGRWRRSEPKRDLSQGDERVLSLLFFPPGEEACKADSEMAGMGRCRVATGLRLMEVPKSKGTERADPVAWQRALTGVSASHARDPGQSGC